MSILFVCQGNICRSPAAERLLRRELDAVGDVPILSAGTNALVGNPIDPPMVALLQAAGADTADFAARQLTEAHIEAAELIITMTRRQRSVVVSLVPKALDRTFTLRELTRLTELGGQHASVPDLSAMRSTVDLAAEDLDILDPYRRGPERYAESFEQVKRSVTALAAWLSGQESPLPTESTEPTGPAPAAITVLESFREPGPQTNPYITMLAACLRQTPGLRVRTFSWREALLGDYDVFHAHWPEILLNRRGFWRKRVHRALFAILLVKLRARRITVVRTVHNLNPHERLGRATERLLRRFDQLTTLRIVINSVSPVDLAPSALILHGHYRGWYGRWPASERVPGRIAYFGLIRSYKGVQQLASAFAALPSDTPLSLTIAGQCIDPAIGDELQRIAARHPRIHLALGFVSDEDLVRQITEAELVALPYRAMHNSGGALAALSLDRPILVPDGESSRSLAAEVGPRWVQRFTDELTADDLQEAVRRAQTLPVAGHPDLSRREWDTAGEAHRAAFNRAVRLRRGRSAKTQ